MQKIAETWLPLFLTLITGALALSQIRSNNITNARLKWLENLKQLVTDFFSECNIMHWKEIISIGVEERRHLSIIASETDSFIQKNNQSLINHLTAIDAKLQMIKLNLNPKEKLHIKLEGFIEGYIDILNKIPGTKSSDDHIRISRKLTAYSDTINIMLRYIMKLEWEKTKRSRLGRYRYFYFGKGKALLREALTLELVPERAAL